MSAYDLWFGRMVRLTFFLIGAGIAVWETLHDNAGHPWAYAAAATFSGLPAARTIEDVIRALASSSLGSNESTTVEIKQESSPTSDKKPPSRGRK